MSDSDSNIDPLANGSSTANNASPASRTNAAGLNVHRALRALTSSRTGTIFASFSWENLKKKMMLKKPLGQAPGGVIHSLKVILCCSWTNILLVCIPISWALNFTKKDDHILVFIFTYLSIIPLAKLFALATDELALRLNMTLAGLLNATMGNAVELIIAIVAVLKCQLEVVQSSLIGSILSNLLLGLGLCFFAGGTRFSEQGFGISATQINTSLLTISVIAMLLPAAFHSAVQPDASGPNKDPLADGVEGEDIKKLSHGVAVILLFIYISYLVFQLWSHADLYSDEHATDFRSTRYPKRLSDEFGPVKAAERKIESALHIKRSYTARKSIDRTEEGLERTDEEASVVDHVRINVEPVTRENDEDELEQPELTLPWTLGMLVIVTSIKAVNAWILVDSIDGVTEKSPFSKEWIGLILLPIVGSAAERLTDVSVAVKDKLTLSIGVAVGSSIQIALFVFPLMVVLAWILGKPLLLLFDPFESVTLFLAVLTVNYVVQDGKSNWLEGMILMCLYVIIAVMFWFYPGSDIQNILAKCTPNDAVPANAIVGYLLDNTNFVKSLVPLFNEDTYI